MTPKFGATGKHPRGHLTPDDEGELQFGVTTMGRNVAIQFGKPVSWFAMPPELARQFAALLNQHADEAEKQGTA